MLRDNVSAPARDRDAVARLLAESRRLIERSRHAQAHAEAASSALVGVLHASEGICRELERARPQHLPED